MWREYKSSRRLSEKELKLLFHQLNGFVNTWDEMGSDRCEPYPCQSVAGRTFLGYSDPKPTDQVCIQLGLGVKLFVRLLIPAAELTEPDANRLKSGGRRFCLSHIAEAWVEGWPGHQSVVRHQTGVQIREISLSAFLKSKCEHCFESYIKNEPDHRGTFLISLDRSLVDEDEKNLRQTSPRRRALFASHKHCLMSDARLLAVQAWRLYRSDKCLESEIVTGEFDHISETNLEELDVNNLLWTMINGISSAGDQLCRNRQVFPDIWYDVF
jgi:hypothetical protein